MIDMEYLRARLDSHLAKVAKRKVEEEKALQAVRSSTVMMRRSLLLGMAACVGVAVLMPQAKAAFDVDIIDVRRTGAKGDGTTDDTTAIQAALNMKGHVYLPPGQYVISSTLTFQTAGQRMFGSGGSYISTLTCKSGFSGVAALDFNNYQPGPQLAGIRLTTAVPGTPANGIDAADCPRFKIQDCRITLFNNGIDMTGNSGGADINNLEIWSRSTDITINGSVDTINMSGLRVWPFDDPSGVTITASMSGTTLTVTAVNILGLAKGQTITGTGVTSCTILSQLTGSAGSTGTYQISVSQTVSSRSMTATGLCYLNHTGIITARCDGLFISNSMFLCENQINFATGGSGGDTIGSITTTDFDSFNGIIQFAGQLSITSCFFTGGIVQGNTCTSNITLGGGRLVVSGCWFSNTVSLLIGVATVASAPYLTLSACTFEMAGSTNSALSMSAGAVVLSDSQFTRNSAIGGNFIINVTGGRLTAIGNRSPIDGTGNFIRIVTDDWHRVVYNATGAWTNSFPAAVNGIYTPQ